MKTISNILVGAALAVFLILCISAGFPPPVQPQNILGGTGISVSEAVVGQVQTWTITATGSGGTSTFNTNQLNSGPLGTNIINGALATNTVFYAGLSPGSEKVSVDTAGYVLRDNNGQVLLDWRNEIISDSGGNTAIDWGQRLLLDSQGFAVAQWGNELLLNGAGAITVDWQNDFLYAAGPSVSVDWNNKLLQNAAGNPVLNWQTGLLSGTATNVTAGSAVGTAGQVLTATGAGIAWSNAPSGGTANAITNASLQNPFFTNSTASGNAGIQFLGPNELTNAWAIISNGVLVAFGTTNGTLGFVHLSGNMGGAPTVSAGAALGGGTASLDANANDTGQTVTLTTTVSASLGVAATITFGKTWDRPPHVSGPGLGSIESGQLVGRPYITNITTTSYQILWAIIPVGSTNYVYTQICAE